MPARCPGSVCLDVAPGPHPRPTDTGQTIGEVRRAAQTAWPACGDAGCPAQGPTPRATLQLTNRTALGGFPRDNNRMTEDRVCECVLGGDAAQGRGDLRFREEAVMSAGMSRALSHNV